MAAESTFNNNNDNKKESKHDHEWPKDIPAKWTWSNRVFIHFILNAAMLRYPKMYPLHSYRRG